MDDCIAVARMFVQIIVSQWIVFDLNAYVMEYGMEMSDCLLAQRIMINLWNSLSRQIRYIPQNTYLKCETRKNSSLEMLDRMDWMNETTDTRKNSRAFFIFQANNF